MNFYLIDKPIHLTSFDVIRHLKKKLGISKIGHTGTLDPLATGCLLIATGAYTKLIPYFEKTTKQYYFKVNFDGETASYDLGTPVKYISKESQKIASREITKKQIENLLKKKFIGKIYQIPPKYSALKISGKRALNKILNGEDFEMQKRLCEIYEIELLDYEYPTASFNALVSFGTYIRSIANDLGRELGVAGYVTELRRTKIGNLDLTLAQKLEDFDKNKILDIKELFKGKNFITLDFQTLEKINTGIKVIGKFDFETGVELFVFDGKSITNIVRYDGNALIPVKKIQ